MPLVSLLKITLPSVALFGDYTQAMMDLGKRFVLAPNRNVLLCIRKRLAKVDKRRFHSVLSVNPKKSRQAEKEKEH